MDDQNRHFDDNSQGIVNKELARGIQKLYSTNLIVPSEVDEAILSKARQQLARRPARVAWRWAGAAAAVVLLAVGLYVFPRSERPTVQTPAQAFLKEDIDRDGRVDILDAFALARTIESSGEPNANGDINQDGRVDQEDVDAIARKAVRLDTGAL